MAAGFDFQHRLGAGYFGEVWQAIDTGLECEIALKCIPPDKIVNTENLHQEAQTLKSAEHPNIVRVNETGTLGDKRVYVSMEYLSRGSVEDEAIGGLLGLPRAKRLMVDVLRGLGHAHHRNIVHRDIKPANIMVGNSGEGKLSDFGLAVPNITSIDPSKFKEYQYLFHLAPEVRSIKDYTKISDIYACGVTLYRLVNGDSYLPTTDVTEAIRLSKRGDFPDRTKYREFVPTGLRRLINRAMNITPKDRFSSADEMRHALEAQSLLVKWSERATSNGRIWEGESENNRKYRMCLFTGSKGKWSVEFKHATSGTLRRKKADCFEDLSKAGAYQKVRTILQRLTQTDA